MTMLKQKKKADMNFWLVMLVLALIFMVLLFFVMNKVFSNWSKTTEKVQQDINKQTKETDIFGNLESDSDKTTDNNEKNSATG